MESGQFYMAPCENKDKKVELFRLEKALEKTQMVGFEIKLDGVAQSKQKTEGFKRATNNVKKSIMRFNKKMNVYEDIYEITKKLICKSTIKI